MSRKPGFLAIWSDVSPADETDYLHWLTREHAQERLSVPGFSSVRVFRAEAEALSRFLIFYRLQSAEVAASEAYLARLNAPTAWSQRIMPKLTNFIRGSGNIRFESGAGEGMFAAPLLFETSVLPLFRAAADDAAKGEGVVAARLLETDQAATEIQTSEKSMRQGDRSFAAMLLLEALDARFLTNAAKRLPAEAGAEPLRVYRQVFARSNA